MPPGRGRRVTALTAAGIALLAVAVAAVIAYRVIGTRVDAEGWLHEPFALVPVAWLAGIGGTALIAIAVWRGRRGADRRTARAEY